MILPVQQQKQTNDSTVLVILKCGLHYIEFVQISKKIFTNTYLLLFKI